MNLFGFMADQNEETLNTSESPESVSLADASAEKATEGSDADLEVEGDCFRTICPHQPFPLQSCTYHLVYIRNGDQGQNPARVLTTTSNLAVDKGRGHEFPSKSSPFDVKHFPSTALYTP